MSELKNVLGELFGTKFGKVLSVISGILIVYCVIAFVFSLFPFTLIGKVVNTNAIVQNYEWYYDQYNVIKATEANIKIIENQMVYYDTETRTRKMTEVAGMRMVLNNMIAEYNSKSKQITRNLWKAEGLPYQIEF